jgi:hypothetical protein
MADAAAEHAPSAAASLPHAVVLLVFAQLPVDLRARCACVCRGWRAALCERSLWTRLDVSRTSGVTKAVTDAFLRGAAARAGGELEALDVSGCRTVWLEVLGTYGGFGVSREALLAVVTAAAGTLRELRACSSITAGVANTLSLGDAEALLRAAPQLRVFDANVGCNSVTDARRALRAEGLLAPLRVHRLCVDHRNAAEADVRALAADVASHAWLQVLRLVGALPTPAALDAVVDAALTRRLTVLQFVHNSLYPAAAPALARLLGGGAVADLCVSGVGGGAALLDAPAAVLLANALRANAALTSLRLCFLRFWEDVAAAATLLGALRAHPSLRTVSLSCNTLRDADCAAAGAALGALLAANAPALTELDVGFCELQDAGMAPLFEALPRNTHLRTLLCGGNDITEAFADGVLLPAARANASLRALVTDQRWASEREAEEIVKGRAAAP